MDLLSGIAQRATVIVIVAVAVLAIAGVPASRARYRTLAILLTILSALAACEWYVRFAIHSYVAQQTMWIDLVGLVVFVLATVVGIIEASALLWFRHRMHSEHRTRSPADGLPHAS